MAAFLEPKDGKITPLSNLDSIFKQSEIELKKSHSHLDDDTVI